MHLPQNTKAASAITGALYKSSWFVITPLLRVLFHAKVEGVEHVPKRGAAILASNHLSFLDHFLLGSVVQRKIHYISKVQHFDYPVRRFLFSSWGVIPLRRGEGDSEAFDRSLDVLNQGKLFAIYPEGTRSLDGKLHKGHTGVARLAVRSGAAVVPAAMIGTFEAMPKGRSVPKLSPCAVKFGRPLRFEEFEGRGDDRIALREITDRIMRAIRDLSGQDYVDEYQYNPEVKTHARPPSRGTGNGGQAAERKKTRSA